MTPHITKSNIVASINRILGSISAIVNGFEMSFVMNQDFEWFSKELIISNAQPIVLYSFGIIELDSDKWQKSHSIKLPFNFINYSSKFCQHFIEIVKINHIILANENSLYPNGLFTADEKKCNVLQNF